MPHVRIWPGGDGQPSSLPGPIGSQRLLFILISKGREADASDLIGPEPSEHLPDQKQGACLAEKPKTTDPSRPARINDLQRNSRRRSKAVDKKNGMTM